MLSGLTKLGKYRATLLLSKTLRTFCVRESPRDFWFKCLVPCYYISHNFYNTGFMVFIATFNNISVISWRFLQNKPAERSLKIIKKMQSTELQISCVFAFFTLWKRVKTHVLSDQSVHITHTYCCVSKLSKFGAYLYSRVHNNTFLSLRNSP